MEEMQAIIDNFLLTTKDRKLIPTAELQDFLLDLRLAIMKEQEKVPY